MSTLFRELSQVHGMSRVWSESEYSLHCHIWVLQHTEVFSTSESSFVLPKSICSKCPGAQGSFKILLLKRNEIYHSCQCNSGLQRDNFHRLFSEEFTTQLRNSLLNISRNARHCHELLHKISKFQIVRGYLKG